MISFDVSEVSRTGRCLVALICSIFLASPVSGGRGGCGISAELAVYKIWELTGLDGYLESLVTLTVKNTGDDTVTLDYTLLKHSVWAVGVEYAPGIKNSENLVYEDRMNNVYSLCILKPRESITISLLLADFLPLDWRPTNELVIVSRYQPASNYPDWLRVTDCRFESAQLVIPTAGIKNTQQATGGNP